MSSSADIFTRYISLSYRIFFFFFIFIFNFNFFNVYRKIINEQVISLQTHIGFPFRGPWVQPWTRNKFLIYSPIFTKLIITWQNMCIEIRFHGSCFLLSTFPCLFSIHIYKRVYSWLWFHDVTFSNIIFFPFTFASLTKTQAVEKTKLASCSSFCLYTVYIST